MKSYRIEFFGWIHHVYIIVHDIRSYLLFPYIYSPEIKPNTMDNLCIARFNFSNDQSPKCPSKCMHISVQQTINFWRNKTQGLNIWSHLITCPVIVYPGLCTLSTRNMWSLTTELKFVVNHFCFLVKLSSLGLYFRYIRQSNNKNIRNLFFNFYALA